MRSIEDSKIVIIGGSSGIGLATAAAAAEAGASVVIASRSEEKLAEAAAQISGAVETLVVDMADEAGLERFFDEIGEFDHLATPGTAGYMAPLEELDFATARGAVDTKVWGQLMAAKHGAPRLRQGGSVVLYSGVSSQRPPAVGGALPAMMNAAVEGMGRALALELAPIRVNTISPGVVDTPLYGWMSADDRAKMFERLSGSLPARRVGQAADVAEAALFLMRNGFMTGETLYIDGGRQVA